jgi:pilus assembly protein CpaE
MTSYLVPDSTPDPGMSSLDIVNAQGITVPVAVVDTDPGTRNRLAIQLGDHAIPVDSVEQLAPRLTGAPMVIVIGPTLAADAALGGAEELLLRRPEVGAVVVADELTTELFQRAMRLGVRDVLAMPVDGGQLVEAVARVGGSLSPAGGASPFGAVADADDGTLGKVITVFSTKGGAGKSVVASNMAVMMAQRSDKPVVLVDADLQFGDIAVMLKLAPQHTIVDAVSSIDRLEVSLLQSILVQHQPSGLLVLPAPLEPAFADQIGAEEMAKIIALLRTFCAYVIVDTPAYFNDVVLGLIEESDEVLLVAGMDIPNIKNVKIGLQTLRLLNTPMSKIHLVLNRANSKVKLEVSEVERTLQVKAESLIPSDVVVPQSVNKGTPVVIDAPRAGVSKALEQLADKFCPAVDPKKKRR